MSAVPDVRPSESASRSYYEDELRFPGYGTAPERCRGLQPVGFCRDRGHLVLGRSSCETRRCPDDWRDWLENAVVSAVARLAAYRHVADGWEKRLVHAAVSAPQNRRYTTERFWEARSESVDVAKEVGIRGGMLIPHPYRSTDAGEEFFETVVEHGDWDESRGKWALFRREADDWGEMQEYIEAAPHFHVLGPAEDVTGEAARGNWVGNNIRSFERFQIDEMDGYRDMASGAYYVLTHGSVMQGRNTISWFGELHGSTFKPEEELSAEEWSEIQRRAELAVKTREDDEGGGIVEEWHADLECPDDDCLSEVVPIERLHEYLARSDWMVSLGREQRRILRGVASWVGGDRPPPRVRGSKDALLSYLAELGRSRPTTGTTQAFIGSFA